MLGFFLENLSFEKGSQTLQRTRGQGQSSRRALLRPAVLTTAPIKQCLYKTNDLKFFAKLFAKSLPPEAFVLPDKSKFELKHNKRVGLLTYPFVLELVIRIELMTSSLPRFLLIQKILYLLGFF